MKRKSFIHGLVGGITALVVAKPVEAESDGLCECCDEPPGECIFDEGLWPNDKPFPCYPPPGYIGTALDCRFCRLKHNRKIIASDPEWYEGVELDRKTGKWGVTGYLGLGCL